MKKIQKIQRVFKAYNIHPIIQPQKAVWYQLKNPKTGRSDAPIYRLQSEATSEKYFNDYGGYSNSVFVAKILTRDFNSLAERALTINGVLVWYKRKSEEENVYILIELFRDRGWNTFEAEKSGWCLEYGDDTFFFTDDFNFEENNTILQKRV